MHDDWQDQWRMFLTRAVTAEQVVEHCFTLVGQTWGLDPVAKLRPGNADLVALANLGANPRVVVEILLGKSYSRMSPELLGDAFFERDAELTVLSSPRYWVSILSKLEGARGALQEFMSTGAYQRIAAHPGRELDALVYPFSRICKEVQEVDNTVAALVKSIRTHRLDQADTSLKDQGLSVAIAKTSGKQGRKTGSGVPRESDYTSLSLDSYFRKRTPGPNTRVIGRLLHFAGLDRFPCVAMAAEGTKSSGRAMDEVNRIRKRIVYLRRDLELLASVNLNLCFRESDYETRDPVDFGGGIWRPF